MMSTALDDMVRRGATDIHLTTGERVGRRHAAFFRAYGFAPVDWHLGRYRRGTSEVVWVRPPGGIIHSSSEATTSPCHRLKTGTP